MIAHIRGKLISKTPQQAIVETAGMGYDVAISVQTYAGLPREGSEVALHIHTHVREDALALFGFGTRDEKRLFEKLIAVSGVGPKLALAVLSGMSSEFLVSSIRGNDLAQLTRIPGVGKKTAERLVLELRDKLDDFAAAAVSPVEEDVISALVNLGYQRPQAEKAIEKTGPRSDFDSLFKAALGVLRK
jgi:holliday junction DNA helicase RuvA